MTYYCEDCGFLFSRRGEVRACPACERQRFRPATAEEKERLRELLRQNLPHGEEYVL